MKENFKKTKNGLIVQMPKEIDHHTADGIKKEVDKRIEYESIANVIFDFKDTEFMDSSGIGLVLGRYKMVQYLGGSIRLINISDGIKRIFKMSGIEKIIGEL